MLISPIKSFPKSYRTVQNEICHEMKQTTYQVPTYFSLPRVRTCAIIFVFLTLLGEETIPIFEFQQTSLKDPGLGK